jgi:predicted acyltransferase
MEPANHEETSGRSIRNPAIDQFRGISILLMVVADYLGQIKTIPSWLKHAADIGVTAPDFIAPCFVFAIGLTFGISVKRRLARDKWEKTIVHVVARAMALVGIGALFTIGETHYGFNTGGVYWGVLQALGVATLLTFPLLFLPWQSRLAVSLCVLCGYQWLLDHVWLSQVLQSSHAGIQGALSWTAMMVLATVVSDLYHSTKRPMTVFWLCTLALFAAGCVLALWVFPISKHRMSISFVLVAVSCAAAAFGVFHLLGNRLHAPLSMLRIWGANPLVLYIAHNFLMAIFVVPRFPGWYAEAPWWLILLQLAAFIAALHVIGYAMFRRKIVVSL